MEIISTADYESPCGVLTLGACGGRLCMCAWAASERYGKILGRLRNEFGTRAANEDTGILSQAITQLDEYFAGERREFDIGLLLTGTGFQRVVWKNLAEVPYGATMSYKELAGRIGRPEAVRAVANANAANPISIFVPCHRIVGSDGTLTGYAGGLAAKEWLLSHELCCAGDAF